MRDVLMEQLKDTAQRVTVRADGADLAAAVRGRAAVRERRRRNRQRAGFGSAVVAACAAAVLVWPSTDGGELVVSVDSTVTVDTSVAGTDTTPDDGTVTAPDTTGAPATVAPETVPETEPESALPETIPPPPLKTRTSAAVVAAGENIFVWGGFVPNHVDGSEPPFRDGALWDAESRTWRSIASDAPVRGLIRGSAGTAEHVTLVDAAGNVGRYDIADDRWSLVRQGCPENADCADASPVVVDGDEILLFGQRVLVDASTGSTRPLPTPSKWPTNSRAFRAGDSVYVAGSASEFGGAMSVLRFDTSTEQWAEVNPPVPSVGWPAFGIGPDDGLVMTDFAGMRVDAYDPATAVWKRLPALPQIPVKCQATVHDAHGSLVVEMCGQMHVWLDDEQRWATFDRPRAWPNVTGLFDESGVLMMPDGDLFADGERIDTSLPEWWRRDVTANGLRVSAGLDPRWRSHSNADDIGPSSVTAELATGCSLTVAQTVSSNSMRRQRDAMAEAAAGPTSIAWATEQGAFTLACASAEEYSATFASLDTAGERTEATDATGMVGAGTIYSVEELETKLGAVLLGDARRTSPNAELSWGGGPGTVDGNELLYYDVGIATPADPAGPERVYRVWMVEDKGVSYTVQRVESQYVCRTKVEPGALTCPSSG